MFLGSIAGIGGLTAQVFLSAKTGKGRVGNVEWCRSDTAIGFSGRASILWNETATNITSLVIHSNAANGFGTGSKVSLYKLVR
jgi:hypothetical protein